LKCGSIFKIKFVDFRLRNTRCHECSKNVRYTINSIGKICKKLGYEVLSLEYKNSKTHMKFRHKECGKILIKTWGCFYRGNQRCSDCRKEERSKFNRENRVRAKGSLFSFYPEISESWSIKNEDSPDMYTPYCDTRVFWSCPKGHPDYLASIVSRTRAGTGCPVCSESQGEKRIRKFFENKNISFISQKRFDTCRDKQPLPFDFFLPDYSLCLEYNGIFHYKTIRDFTSKSDLKDRKKKDKIKKKWAIKNGYRFIEIPYWKFENIEEILTEELNIK
jgi:hypothetical protein